MKFSFFKVQHDRQVLISFCIGLLLCLSSSVNLVYAAESSETIVDDTLSESSPLLKELQVQQELALMKTRLNAQIKTWGDQLTADDFEWTLYGRMLKPAKRIEVCNIFQNVINETYQLLQQNKSQLTADNQKALESRHSFIQQLGIKNNTIPTKMGFSCMVK
ncbi:MULTISPECIES: hypothetical protein [unclassified Acinetobacter]|uniref:hypothetical protein n=1 Tax=unclassified Acinetobacter TaxID=196816 RepID=UPI00293489B7|nr:MULTISPECIES: hypothetical protein [unclassified Acinetobacter]WOE31393.1 hypothetical protein QSG84_13905 [Acinetobacter sp. SAAs470]WOE39589.1 hypothetical protein QSG86_07570 [Acinetobacter sp. SAAs474]